MVVPDRVGGDVAPAGEVDGAGAGQVGPLPREVGGGPAGRPGVRVAVDLTTPGELNLFSVGFHCVCVHCVDLCGVGLDQTVVVLRLPHPVGVPASQSAGAVGQRLPPDEVVPADHLVRPGQPRHLPLHLPVVAAGHLALHHEVLGGQGRDAVKHLEAGRVE